MWILNLKRLANIGDPLFPVCHNYSTLPNMCFFAHCLGERRDYTHTREPYGEFLPGRDH